MSNQEHEGEVEVPVQHERTRHQRERDARRVLKDLKSLEDFKEHPNYNEMCVRAVLGDISQNDIYRLQMQEQSTCEVATIRYIPALDCDNDLAANGLSLIHI